MIYTLTLNPSLDYLATVPNLSLGSVNRTTSETLRLGGKGINVSWVLNNLNIPTTALGFTAGFTGHEIKRQLHEAGISQQLISTSGGLSRINLKLTGPQGETEINGSGPVISPDELAALYTQLDALTSDDFLVLAGSLPQGISSTLYADIMAYLSPKHIQVVVDATGQNLLNTLSYAPFLIKPNHLELGELFQTHLHTADAIISHGKKLQALGARHVLVSRGAAGAILITQSGEVFEAPAPKGVLVNAVGSGDSMVAGFLAGYLPNKSLDEAFYFGLVAGSATAFSLDLATSEEIYRVLSQITDKPLT